jgi:acyl carrier protein
MKQDERAIREKVRTFIAETFYVADEDVLADDGSLLDQGVVDSTGFIEIIGFVEDSFGFEVSDQDMTPENFETIGRIVGYVGRRLTMDRA